MDDALGSAGRSRGINKRRDFIVLRFYDIVLFLAVFNKLMIRKGSFRDIVVYENHRFDLGGPHPACTDFRKKRLAADDRFGARVLIDMSGFLFTNKVVDGHNDGAYPPDSRKTLERLRTVGHLEDDPVPPLHAKVF